MTIIVDAYNFIKQIVGKSFLSEREISDWLEIFKEYGRLKQNTVILVFDAGPYIQQSYEQIGRVQIIYSGQNQSADDVIKAWIGKHRNQDLLLVTSDREIRNFAKGINIVSVNSHDFYKMLQRVMEQEAHYEQVVVHTIHKTTDVESVFLDELMELGSRSLIKKTIIKEDVEPVRIRDGKKASKQDKRMLKKIEKI